MTRLRTSPLRWVERQLLQSWRLEGDAAEPGFRLGRPAVGLAGLAALASLAAEGASAVFLDQLWWLHLASGLVLLPVLLVKLVPIGIRFTRYYWDAAVAILRAQPRRGHITPPLLVARVIAPVLVADTVLLLLSGMIMWRLDTRDGAWSTVHNASAIAGAVLLAVHLAYHVRSSVAAIAPRVRPQDGRDTRRPLATALVAASLVTGIIIAVLATPASAFPQGGHRPDRAPAGHAVPGRP